MLWLHCGYDMGTIGHDTIPVLSSMIWIHFAGYRRHAVLIWVPWGRTMGGTCLMICNKCSAVMIWTSEW